MTQTFIPGKDSALETSIAHFQQQLNTLGFNIEEASWLNPVPNVWSVHIRDRDCPLCFTNGKGATAKAALASALGEFFERLSTNYFFADFYLGKEIANGEFVHYPNEKWFTIPQDDSLPAGLLDEHLLAYYDPHQELSATMLVDLQSSHCQRGICALPFSRQSSQETVYIPVNIIGNLYVSNGMSAGNNRFEARVQALSEILERYVKNRIIAEAISLPEIPNHILQQYPKVAEAIATLEQSGFPLFIYDASLGGRYPVICVTLFHPQTGGCFASFGAHPDFGVALERTVTELLQGRNLTDLDIFSAPSFDNEDVADHTNLETHFIDSSGVISWDLFRETADYPFTEWSFKGNTAAEFATLMEIFAAEQIEVYIADYEHLGVYACRILAPGMSDIYPVEDLLLANNNMAIQWREQLLALPDSQYPAEGYLQLLTQLDEEGFDDLVRVRELLGLATGSDNAWYNLRIGELKALLALAGGDLEQALIWTEWVLDFNRSQLSSDKERNYRCLFDLLQLSLDEERQLPQYLTAMKKMYGEQSVNLALAHIAGEQRFYDLFSIDGNLHSLTSHQKLLSAYQKLQTAKKAFWS